MFYHFDEVCLFNLSLLQIMRNQVVLEIGFWHFPVAYHASDHVFFGTPLHVLLHSQHYELLITKWACSHTHLAHIVLMVLKFRFGDALLTIITDGGFSIFIILIILGVIIKIAIIIFLHLHLAT